MTKNLKSKCMCVCIVYLFYVYAYVLYECMCMHKTEIERERALLYFQTPKLNAATISEVQDCGHSLNDRQPLATARRKQARPTGTNLTLYLSAFLEA